MVDNSWYRRLLIAYGDSNRNQWFDSGLDPWLRMISDGLTIRMITMELSFCGSEVQVVCSGCFSYLTAYFSNCFIYFCYHHHDDQTNHDRGISDCWIFSVAKEDRSLKNSRNRLIGARNWRRTIHREFLLKPGQPGASKGSSGEKNWWRINDEDV